MAHPDYERGTERDDLALLVLVEPFQFNEHVAAVELPQAGADFKGTATVVGWGRTRREKPENETQTQAEGSEEAEPIRHNLRAGVVPILDGSICRQFYPESEYHEIVDDELMICAGRNGTDTCKGDSGGPLICLGAGPQGRRYLSGVTSWGEGCRKDSYPGAYTRVSAYTSWIQQKIGAFNNTQDQRNQIYCGDSVTKPRAALCNGVKDCGSGVDEICCGSCPPTQFRCAASGRCISPLFVCEIGRAHV